MWGYPDPFEEVAALADFVAFYWDRVDGWYEEDEEIFVHPRDPYKRVDVIHSSRPVQIIVGGETVAETRRARFLFETRLPTRYYIPPEDVRMDLLVPSEKTTACPYKGRARYYSVKIGDRVWEDLVWSYPEPIAECPKIKGYLCFFNEHVDEIRVDGVARAAAGDAMVEGLEGQGEDSSGFARPGGPAVAVGAARSHGRITGAEALAEQF